MIKKILNTIWVILNSIIPIDRIRNILIDMKPLLCRHDMIYFDMKWIVEDEDLKRFDEKVWKDTFCECQKCGVQKRKSMKVGEWGKWINCKFETNENSYVEIEINKYGSETKRQKRDRLIDDILKNK